MALPGNSGVRSSPPSAPQSAGNNTAPGTSLPLGGAPTPAPNSPGGSTPPTASGMGQGYCSFPLNAPAPAVIGLPPDRATPGAAQPGSLGQLALGGSLPGSPANGQDVPASQANPTGNPNPGALSGSGRVGANQVNPTGNPNPGAL